MYWAFAGFHCVIGLHGAPECFRPVIELYYVSASANSGGRLRGSLGETWRGPCGSARRVTRAQQYGDKGELLQFFAFDAIPYTSVSCGVKSGPRRLAGLACPAIGPPMGATELAATARRRLGTLGTATAGAVRWRRRFALGLVTNSLRLELFEKKKCYASSPATSRETNSQRHHDGNGIGKGHVRGKGFRARTINRWWFEHEIDPYSLTGIKAYGVLPYVLIHGNSVSSVCGTQQWGNAGRCSIFPLLLAVEHRQNTRGLR